MLKQVADLTQVKTEPLARVFLVRVSLISLGSFNIYGGSLIRPAWNISIQWRMISYNLANVMNSGLRAEDLCNNVKETG